MTKKSLATMAMAAGLLAATIVPAQPAAATTPCSDYEFTATNKVAAGVTFGPWAYFISPNHGTIEVCLQGPAGSDPALWLKQHAAGGPKVVASVPAGGGAYKTLLYVGEPAAYTVDYYANVTGYYTVGVNVP